MSEEPHSNPIEEQKPDDSAQEWHQIAQDAAENWPLEHPGVAALYENHVVPQLHNRGLGHLAISERDESDAILLHGRDSNLHLSPEVEYSVDYLRQQGNRVPNEPVKKIAAYMNLAKDVEHINDGILTGSEESIARQVEARVMKTEDVPDSYFEGMRQTYRDEGRGELTITKEMREMAISELQIAQRFSLEEWAAYLGNSKDYPDGFKTYVWNSILKLKPYDPYKESFPKRSKGTVAPFPMFNQDAVSKVFEAVESGDKRSFANLYTEAVHSLDYFDPEILKTVEGQWRKFEKSNDPEAAKELSSTLNEKTGWCVAGESYAGHYLKSGDFWVYYTMGSDGEYTVPRTAIATTNNRIREIRGILPGQVLEPQMIEVVYSKAAELPGGEKYLATRDDMKLVTRIFNLVEKDSSVELSAKDLRFLYEFDRNIAKVDGNTDPRIDEIKQQRDWVTDMLTAYGAQNDKELFDAIFANYSEAKDMSVLLSAKKYHPTFGYSLNREEKERERIKSLASRQYEDLLENLPYLSLDATAAEKLIEMYDFKLPTVVANAKSFGFTDTATCIGYMIDMGRSSSLIRHSHYEEMEGVREDLLNVLLERGLERDILKHASDSSMRSAAIEKVISVTDVERDIPDGQYKDDVKSELAKLFDSIKSGKRSYRAILPTLDDVTQFEQALHAYLKELDISSSVFTPNQQRDMEVRVGGGRYGKPNRHGDGGAKQTWSDVTIIDRSDLRAGDLLFRNMSKKSDKIVVSVATKLYATGKLLEDIGNLPLLSQDEIQALQPANAETLYNELLAKEGMPEELTDDETPMTPGELEQAVNDVRNGGLFG